MTNYIGDKSSFINAGLEEAQFQTYRCGVCGEEREVVVDYDHATPYPYPVEGIKAIICCDTEMDLV
jgi:hypothetical protein